MSPGLRSAIQSHRDQNSGSPSSSSSSSSSSHPMMSHMGQGSSQSGGKKRRGRRSSKGKKYRRRSKKAGSNCMNNKKEVLTGRSRAARGGMMAPGLGAVIKEALVPFGIFALQKRTQRRKHSGKKFEKSRRR